MAQLLEQTMSLWLRGQPAEGWAWVLVVWLMEWLCLFASLVGKGLHFQAMLFPQEDRCPSVPFMASGTQSRRDLPQGAQKGSSALKTLLQGKRSLSRQMARGQTAQRLSPGLTEPSIRLEALRVVARGV